MPSHSASSPSTDEVKRHYETLLGAHYAWMSGDLDQRVAETMRLFESLGIRSGSGRALDLGCGNGIQSLALARLGYHVTAVDFNRRLLSELQAHAGDRSIETVEADLVAIHEHPNLTGPVDVVVCMGDTLTHLPTMSDVERLLEHVAHHLLAGGGRLVLGLRDLTVELTGVDRAIPVRLDPERLMLTFLEYHPGQVRVHDLVLQRTGDHWRLDKSAYSKLRISIDRLQSFLQQHGLVNEHIASERGMYHLVAHKPLK